MSSCEYLVGIVFSMCDAKHCKMQASVSYGKKILLYLENEGCVCRAQIRLC